MLTLEEKSFIRDIATKRYENKRKAFISDYRSDGSRCSVENDIDATGAEYIAAKVFQQPFNDRISTSGDSGYDFMWDGKTVEVIWLGRHHLTKKPKKRGFVIVNPHEPKRWADIYVSVRGSLEDEYWFCGWGTHEELISYPMIDFSYGDRFAMPTEELKPLVDLIRG